MNVHKQGIDSVRRSMSIGAAIAVTGAAALMGASGESAALAPARVEAGATDTPNRFIDVDGVLFAYRQLGPASGIPLVLFPHFRGTMDWWDPLLLDGLARQRPVIIFDNRGVGLSQGKTPDNAVAMARDAAAFIRALKLDRVDLFGFSIGGFVAQQLLLQDPGLVRKAVLAGTGTRGGDGMQERRPEVAKAAIQPDSFAGRLFLFFTPSDASQQAGRRFLERTRLRTRGVDPEASAQTIAAHGAMSAEWGRTEGRQEHLKRIAAVSTPVLVVNGVHDIMVPTVNSYLLAQAFPNAKLILYPDAGHGAIFQYPQECCRDVSAFLDGGTEQPG